MIRITSIVKGLFILSFFMYVVSVSWYSWKNMNTYFYFLKHLSALVPALLFTFFLLKRPSISKKLIVLPFLFILIIIPFAVRGRTDLAEVVIFIQLLLFLLSAFVFSKFLLKNNMTFSKIEMIILFIVLLIPPLLDVAFNGSNFIYTTYYGRPRLLLGYYHPKEAGISLLIVAILFKFYFENKISSWKSILFQVIVIILLHFMQSRNSLLFYLNFLFINLLLRKVSITAIIFLYFILPIISLAYITYIYFEELNELTSNRLDLWLKNLDISLLGKGSSIADFDKTNVLSKLHFDNFYLEYLIENGLVFFFLLFALLCAIIFFIGKRSFNSIYINALFIPFLIFCFFDAGMFSSGNFLNLLVWSMVFASLNLDSLKFKKLSLRKNYPISHEIM